MRQVYLETKSDMMWLAETHLPEGIEVSQYSCAILEGNEDCPNKVSLYKVNHYLCIPDTFRRNEEGDLEKVEIVSCEIIRDQESGDLLELWLTIPGKGGIATILELWESGDFRIVQRGEVNT